MKASDRRLGGLADAGPEPAFDRRLGGLVDAGPEPAP